MRKFNTKNSLWAYLFALALIMSLGACKKKNTTPAKTTAEKMANTWRVSRALLNGQVDNAGNYANFRIAFQISAEKAPTNYTVTPGGAPARPNLTPGNSGTWALDAGDTRIVFDRGTTNEFTVTIVETPTEQSLKIQWRVPNTVDKTEPTYQYELVPVQ